MKTIDPFKEDPTVIYGTTPKQAAPVTPDPNYPDPGPYWVWAEYDNNARPANLP